MRRLLLSATVCVVWALPSQAQTPQPFPRAGSTQPARPQPAEPQPAPRAAGSVPVSQAAPAPADPNAPSTAAVGFPVFPGAYFLADYDAGKGQRYYLFGAVASYQELVKWYQTQLRDRGDEVFTEPPTHMFAQRFREDTMVFPPGVTIKDWTWGGSKGYPHPKPGGQPARFPVVIMIVPPLPSGGR
jgi:hypothetical protein